MTSKATITLLVIIAGLLLALLAVNEAKAPVDDAVVDSNGEESSRSAEVLAVLPYELMVGERAVVLDTESPEYSVRSMFNERESVVVDLEGQDPVEYIEERITEELSLSHIQDQSADLFRYSVSFYPEGENGVIAFVRGMGFPDDSVGGSEERYDFVYNDSWSLEWYGDRQYCRRMDSEFWAEPGELCP